MLIPREYWRAVVHEHVFLISFTSFLVSERLKYSILQYASLLFVKSKR